MPSADIENIVHKVSSHNRCTPDTLVNLQRLLSYGSHTTTAGPTATVSAKSSTARPRAATKTAPQPGGRAKTGTKKVVSTDESLSHSEKVKAASLIFNAGLRGLSADLEAHASKPKALRDVSPNKLTAKSKSSNARKAQPARDQSGSGLTVLAECTCLAINVLLKLRSASGVDYRLETGSIALITRLISRGFVNLAWKQLIVLHCTLDVNPEHDTSGVEIQHDKLLSFKRIDLTSEDGDITILNFTSLVLQLLAIEPKIEPGSADLLSALHHSSEFAPENVFSAAIAAGADQKRSIIAARNVARHILQLSSEWSKSGCSEALQACSIALRLRLVISEHDAALGDTPEDAFKVFESCLAKTVQRVPSNPGSYQRAKQGFEDILEDLDLSQRSERATGLFRVICRHLADLASIGGHSSEALSWLSKHDGMEAVSKESQLNACSTALKRAALTLQVCPTGKLSPEAKATLQVAFDLTADHLSGSMSALMAALQDAVGLRKAVIQLLKSTSLHTIKPTSTLALLLRSLGVCTKLSLRVLGPGLDPSAQQGELFEYQNKLDVVSALTKASIEAAIFGVRKVEGMSEVDCDVLRRLLDDCKALLKRLILDCKAGCSTADVDDVVRARIGISISNAYWTLATKRENVLQPQVIMELLSNSCNTLQILELSAQESGSLGLKLYRLGRSAQKFGDYHRARDFFKEAVGVCVRIGALHETATDASWQTLHKVLSSGDLRVLDSALRSIVGIEKTGHDTEQPFFHDAALPLEDQATLLEWQLQLVITRSPESLEADCSVFVGHILDVFDQQRLPLRAIRIFSKVLSICHLLKNENIKQRLFEGARTIASSDSAIVAHSCELGLVDHESRLRVLLGIDLAVASGENCKLLFEQALTLSKAIRRESPSIDGLVRHADDWEAWIGHLEIMSSFFGLQGLENEHLSSLALISEAQEAKCGQHSHAYFSASLDLASQLLDMGYADRAAEYLQRCKMHLGSYESIPWALQVRLASVEACCSSARADLAAVHQIIEKLERLLTDCETRMRKRPNDEELLLSCAELLQAMVSSSVFLGSSYNALLFARRKVSMLQYAWRLQSHGRTELSQPDSTELSCTSGQRSGGEIPQGPAFWALTPRLVRSLLQVSSLSKSYGFIQDAHKATEQAHKLAEGSTSEFLLAQVLVDEGDSAYRCSELDLGKEQFAKAMATLSSTHASHILANTNETFGYSQHIAHEWVAEVSAYDEAQKALNTIFSFDFIEELLWSKHANGHGLVANMESLSLEKAKPQKPKRPAKPSRKRPQHDEASTSTALTKETLERDPVFKHHLVRLGRLRADNFIAQGEISDALQLLDSIEVVDGLNAENGQVAAAFGNCLLQRALSSMATDTVLSMLPESAMSIPSLQLTMPRQASTTPLTSAHRKPQASKDQNSRKPPKGPLRSFEVSLSEAKRHIDSISATTLDCCSNSAISSAAMSSATVSMMQNFLATDTEDHALAAVSVAQSIEMPRIKAVQREQDATIIDDSLRYLHSRERQLSQSLTLSAMKSVEENLDDFEANFIDVLPKSWAAVSMTLADDLSYLYITRYDSQTTPFVLRLPLARQHTDDSMDEALTFEDAMRELMDIIASSDATIERARAKTVDGLAKDSAPPGKGEWWSEREALDARLQDLLTNIENVWLGGFRSIMNLAQPDEGALAKFELALCGILDNHLPSRRKGGADQRRKLDAKITELFVGLGDPRGDDVDLEESLTDLLYFVVDILQFSGERNAYDEIDFDAMIVETQDALAVYHQDMDAHCDSTATTRHLILVLDRRLHIIPWESLPCLDGRSVSRVGSLLDMRQRILLMRRQESSVDGVSISRSHGTVILNPSGDLANTQARFEAPLADSPSTAAWPRIIGRAPTEAEFLAALTISPTSSSNSEPESEPKSAAPPTPLLLYIGHGSGAQFVRGRSVRRLHPSCGAALLLGCSSAALRPAGEFGPLGTAAHYLVAGAPAVLGALWDVTDRDCDAFSAACLRDWGLLSAETAVSVHNGRRRREKRLAKKGDKAGASKAKGKAKGKSEGNQAVGTMSLSEATAGAREECYLKYLNGAAMVVYGVPCYLGD